MSSNTLQSAQDELNARHKRLVEGANMTEKPMEYNVEPPEATKLLGYGGDKHDENKLPMHLVPVSAIKSLAEVLQYGAKEYAPRNWEKGLRWSRPYAAVQRHLNTWWAGETLDPTSGMSHIKHE